MVLTDLSLMYLIIKESSDKKQSKWLLKKQKKYSRDFIT